MSSSSTSGPTVDIKLSRSSRVYRPSDIIEGKIVVKSASSVSHYGVRLSVNRSVNMQERGGSAWIIESLVGAVKPITILNRIIEIRSPGRIPRGTTEMPFSIGLRQPGEDTHERFYETFHGANINIQDTQKQPLLPELKSGGFQVTGKMSTFFSLSDSVSGHLTVDASVVPIQSIDLHLFRTESVLFGDRIMTEISLVHTTQIADGDVCRGLTLPIYVILPHLLTCRTVLAWQFSVEFKISIVITFQSELSKTYIKTVPRTTRLWTVMETFPLELVRTK